MKDLPLKFHDYHLKGYTVLEYGKEIVLHLNWNYPSEDREDSFIQFREVVYYDFTHMEGSIITDIWDVPAEEILNNKKESILKNQRQIGGHLIDSEGKNLIPKGMQGFIIESAIGFEGCIICKEAKQLTPNKPAQDNSLPPTGVAL